MINKYSYKVGLARRVITPRLPMHLAGFTARDRPSEGVLHDIWVKGIAVEDENGSRVVFVSLEVIFITPAICDAVALRVAKSHGLQRKDIVFSATHTHSGPMIVCPHWELSELGEEHNRRVSEYTNDLVDAIEQVIVEALVTLEPAQLWYGYDVADFAVNRRVLTPQGVAAGANHGGPSDHEVPVLKITSPEGTLRAVLFGYACHTTSLTSDHYRISGDYAGFAQIALEEKYPGVQATFLMLCGGDQNALPRGTVELSQQYGTCLADTVERALQSDLQPVSGPLRVVMQSTELDFLPHTSETFQERLQKPEQDLRVKRHAKRMLAYYDAGHPIRSVSYPVQVVAFGDDLKVLFMAGEVVIDYQLKLKQKFGRERFFVAGYTNDVMCYIPSQRVLDEGGYEGGDSRVYYDQPMPFCDGVEKRILSLVDSAMDDLTNAGQVPAVAQV